MPKKSKLRKALNNEALQKQATAIVSREVSRQIGPEGAQKCLTLANIIDQLLPLYRDYQQMVGRVEINLGDIKHFFPEEIWQTLNTNKRQVLAAAVEKEARAVNRAVATTIQYFELHRQHLRQASPDVQAALLNDMRRQQGWDEDEIAQGFLHDTDDE